MHKNARLTPHGRERMVMLLLRGETPKAVGEALGVSPRTVCKWLRRYQEEGLAGLQDRSSRPKRLRSPTSKAVVLEIIALRRQRLTGKHIARKVGVSPATVSRALRRAGLSRLKDLEPSPEVRRYEHAAPGDMIHIDIKRLGRFERPGHRVTGDRAGQSNPRARKQGGYGWEYVHVAIDDHSRLAFCEVYPNEKAVSAIAHLRAAVRWYRSMGITLKRVMTDNGACYKSFAFKAACKELGLKHIRTKPYTPQTNGKAERFIQTALREWAYARAYQTSDQRADQLPRWLHMYNWHRPHGGIKDQTPISRVNLKRNNLLTNHI